jgi:predicted XRE-type DNA-binding protein
MKISKAYDNVFEALEDDVSAAGNLKLRGRLMTEIRRFIDEQGLTQTQAARKLGITQPRLSDLMRGQINRFSLDALVNMAATSGVVIEVKRKASKATTPEPMDLTSRYLTVQSGVSWTGLLVPGDLVVENTSGQAVI